MVKLGFMAKKAGAGEQPMRMEVTLERGPLHAGLVPLLAIVYGLGVGMFLSVEPTRPWILLLVTALVALGTDGIIRSYPSGVFKDVADTAPFLLLPVLLALGAGLFFEDTATGYWKWPAAAASALLLAAALYGQYVSVNPLAPAYPLARFILTMTTYLTAFAFYAVVYSFDLSLLPAAAVVGLVSVLLANDILREAETGPWRTLVYAAAIGLVVAEARWTLHFLPLEGYLAGVFLLLAFYVSTGLVHHTLIGNLTGSIVAEFGGLTVAGLAVVVLARIAAGG
jgi:hypothetical protein